MRIACLGGGPAGLYFALLMKQRDPRAEVTVHERNPPGVTFGWGVVFSDETLGYLAENDGPTHREITATFAHWDAIDIHYRGEVVRSGGHGFSGISRRQLLEILRARCVELGVKLVFEVEVESVAQLGPADLVFVADGVNSKVRTALAGVFRPTIELGSCRFIWLGTRRRFDAFTFLFEETEHGWFQVHAYRFDAEMSTFIVECDEATWRRAGLDTLPIDDAVRFLERLFARDLKGERLLTNRSSWLSFPTVSCAAWRHENIALAGDAVHTAHFSIGSGTKLAMEDAIALARAFDRTGDVKTALEIYESERKPLVERLQKAAARSRTWFENVRRYTHLEPLQFAMSLLTRSYKVSYANLKLRDPRFVERVAAWFEKQAPAPRRAAGSLAAGAAPGETQQLVPAPGPPPPPTPPMFTPFRLRGLTLENRVVVSSMAMYSADDGTPGDFHLVHLGSRAMGGAGLVMTEMTHVSREARITPGCTGMYRPEHVAAWRRIAEFVHTHTRARLGIQIGHAGRKGSTRLMWDGIDEPLAGGNWPIVSASPIPYTPRNQVPREMTRDDMRLVRDQFVAATRMAAEAGFDLLELHMAHGYLLACFLSPLTNRRTDACGGTLENRLRWPLEVLEAVRAAWPEERPISVRISATDWAPDGMTGEEAVHVARALHAHGADVIDVSSGNTVADQQVVWGRMFQTPFADQVRNEARVPTIAVGNISTADEVNSILAAGRADLVAIARRHLYDPYFTLHAAAEQERWEEEWPVPYGPARPRPRPSTPA